MEIIKYKINVLCPDNQAPKTMNSFKNTLLGFGFASSILEEKVLSHNSFYWVLEIEAKKEEELFKRLASGEVTIKGFYRTLFKNLKRVKKIAKKLKRVSFNILQKLKERVSKQFQHNQAYKDLEENINKMSKEEAESFISEKNIKEWEVFLSKELFKVVELERTIK